MLTTTQVAYVDGSVAVAADAIEDRRVVAARLLHAVVNAESDQGREEAALGSKWLSVENGLMIF